MSHCWVHQNPLYVCITCTDSIHCTMNCTLYIYYLLCHSYSHLIFVLISIDLKIVCPNLYWFVDHFMAFNIFLYPTIVFNSIVYCFYTHFLFLVLYCYQKDKEEWNPGIRNWVITSNWLSQSQSRIQKCWNIPDPIYININKLYLWASVCLGALNRNKNIKIIVQQINRFFYKNVLTYLLFDLFRHIKTWLYSIERLCVTDILFGWQSKWNHMSASITVFKFNICLK